jgi:hypothetical protein
MSEDKEPNQGEGDRASARRYDEHVREFVADGKVPDSAGEARRFVETHPEDAAKAERKAKRGPARTSIFDRLERVIERLRGRVRKAP